MSEEEREKWNRKYREIPASAEEPSPDPFYVRSMGRLPAGGLAYDLGCGNGRHAADLARRGFDVIAIDISDEAIKNLRAKIPSPRLHFLRQDLEFELPAPPTPPALVISIFFFHASLPPWILQHLAPGGHAILKIRSSESPDRPFVLRPGEIQLRFPGWRILDQDLEKGDRPAESILIQKPV